MRVLVIGAGLIGLTSAYALRQCGMHVTVVDRLAGPGLETSFANGGLLSPGMSDPWNVPGVWRALLSSIGRSDAALQLRIKALPSMVHWGIRFLRASSSATVGRSTLANLRLGLYSLQAMARLQARTCIEYQRGARGILKVFRLEQALEQAEQACRPLIDHGLLVRRLSNAETTALEPGLAPVSSQIAGSLHFPHDESGDAYVFCAALTRYLQNQGVEFRFNTTVSALSCRRGKVLNVRGDRELPDADVYVVAAGSYSAPLLRSCGLGVPVYPAKGYSVTFDVPASEPLLRIPVVDDFLHAGIVPLGSTLRVVGTAEFAGYDHSVHPARVQNLLSFLNRILPSARLDPEAGRPWCGLRPMSADGVPIIGDTPFSNLWINTGHGHLGWTLAMGSAHLLAALLSGDALPVEASAFALARFG
jgi:D-amino-acid dehydrogenase